MIKKILGNLAKEQKDSLRDIFKSGSKPSVLLNYPVDKKYIKELKDLGYHYKVFHRSVTYRSSKSSVVYYWFFQNKEMKQEFKRLKIHKKFINHKPDHYNMGRLLGFPPMATELFCDKSIRLRDIDDKIGVDYCGIIFMSYKESIINDLMWLNSNVKIDKDKNFSVVVHSMDYKFFSEFKVNENYNFELVLYTMNNYLNKSTQLEKKLS